MPDRDADGRGDDADGGASMSTERSTWRREPPIVRTVANSRVRCATVIDSVLKITNAPTKSATTANASRK